MTRTDNLTDIIQNTQVLEKPNSIVKNNCEGINLLEPNYCRTKPLEVMIINRDAQTTGKGRMFTPGPEDTNRIYHSLKNELPKDKALEYTKEEVNYLLSIDSCMVVCIEDQKNNIIGITITYAAKYLPEEAQKEKWHQEGGFSPEIFSHNTSYSELRAVNASYRGNGLGDALRSKQILDSASEGYSKFVFYSVLGAYKNNVNYGFHDFGRVKLMFHDGTVSELHLMGTDINKDTIKHAQDILDKHLIR
jgi:hypothetical protein